MGERKAASSGRRGFERELKRPEPKLRLAAIGMEAEFELHLDDVHVKPEDAFGDPRAFIRGPLMHRTGT